MLVLSRRSGEKILIKDQVTITVIAIQGGRIRIGVEAPPEMSVRRCEILGRAELLIATKDNQVRPLDHQRG